MNKEHPTSTNKSNSTIVQHEAQQTMTTENTNNDGKLTVNSTNTGEVTQEKIVELYREELRRLYLFAARWQAALPVDNALAENEKRRAVALAIKEIITDNKTVNSAEQGREILSRITAVLSDGGKTNCPSDVFDLNEVLNPGELDLESLCKELGVMD